MPRACCYSIAKIVYAFFIVKKRHRTLYKAVPRVSLTFIAAKLYNRLLLNGTRQLIEDTDLTAQPGWISWRTRLRRADTYSSLCHRRLRSFQPPSCPRHRGFQESLL